MHPETAGEKTYKHTEQHASQRNTRRHRRPVSHGQLEYHLNRHPYSFTEIKVNWDFNRFFILYCSITVYIQYYFILVTGAQHSG